MKFKKLAEVIDHKYIRVTVKMSDRCVKILDSTTGMTDDFIKAYGEYKVDSIRVSLIDTSFFYGVLAIYLKDNEDDPLN